MTKKSSATAAPTASRLKRTSKRKRRRKKKPVFRNTRRVNRRRCRLRPLQLPGPHPPAAAEVVVSLLPGRKPNPQRKRRRRNPRRRQRKNPRKAGASANLHSCLMQKNRGLDAAVLFRYSARNTRRLALES